MSLSTDRTPFGSKPCNVFLSYLRGDTHVPLVSHLINYLKNAGISVVINSAEIGRGKPIGGTLQCLIDDCDICIIIFSENYASCNSRLLELASIVKAVGKEIIPVFYGVTTEDVKLNTDKYRRQLSQHTAESEATIQEWREALRGTPRILGLKRPPRDADLCQGILERVQDLIRQKERLVTLRVTLRNCPKLRSTEGLGLGSTSPTILIVEDCTSFTTLCHTSQSRNLIEMIIIRNCDIVEEVPFGQLESLKVLKIENCPSLESLSNVASARNLEELHVTNCPNLREIKGLEELRGSLRIVNIDGCSSLQSVESSLSQNPRGIDCASESLQTLKHPNMCSCPDESSSSNEEPEASNSTPTPSSILSTCADHAESKVEMHQPDYSQRATSSSASTESTQQDAKELAILDEYDHFLLLSKRNFMSKFAPTFRFCKN